MSVSAPASVRTFADGRLLRCPLGIANAHPSLSPVDFAIAKLRRGTELDLDDALFVAQKFGVSPGLVKMAAESAVAASPKDTALFAFRQTVDLFCQRLQSG